MTKLQTEQPEPPRSIPESVSPLFTVVATAVLSNRAAFLGTDYAAQLASLDAIAVVVVTAIEQVKRRLALQAAPYMPAKNGKKA